MQDENVRADHFSKWWYGLKERNVPRKLWILRQGHVDPFDGRRAVWVDTIHRWFDYWLQGVPNGIMSEPAVDIEESADVWKSYTDWPIPGTQMTDVFLQGVDAASQGALGGSRRRDRLADLPRREPEREQLAQPDQHAGQQAHVPLGAAEGAAAPLGHADRRARRRR